MLLNHLVLAILWILYGVLHSVLASVGVKKKMQRMLGPSYKHYRLAYTLFAFVTLLALLWYQLSIDTIRFYKPTFIVVAIGYLITLTGFGIMLTCIKKYFMGLSGLRSLFQESTAKPELIISGIHRFVRHPLYLGTFLFLWGLLVLAPTLSLLIANLIITVYTIVAIRFEEEKLVAEFGDDYRNYQKSVPKIIPKWQSTV